MASGNLLLGYGRRSIGDVTFYRSGGQQRSRARNRNPRNPRTEKQAIQRMILATASKMAAAYTPIVNHSWEGVEVGQPSVQRFRSLAMKSLRSAAAAAINQSTDPYPFGNYDLKGSPAIGSLDGLRISSGSLGINGVIVRSSSVYYTLSEALAASITSQVEYENELKKLSLQPGDQITYLVLSTNYSQPVATFTLNDVSTFNYAQRLQFCRVVLVPTLPENFSGALIVDGSINPALIQESQGLLPQFSESTTGGNHLVADFAAVLDADYEIEGAGVIRSQKQLDGKFKYSNSTMRLSTSVDANTAGDVYPSYMDGVGEINVGDVLYLKHAVASPFGMGE